MSKTIFIIESQPDVCRYAKQSLETAGYAVKTFSTCDVLSQIETIRPSLVLISLNLPKVLNLCRQIRASCALAETAIIFLVDNASEAGRTLARESGGDDCIVKPLCRDKLLSSVRMALHRFRPSELLTATSADLVIDTWALKLCVRGVEVPFTILEFRLIDYMARHRGQVFRRNSLLDAIWGEMRFVTPRSVDACIRRIRWKIEPNHRKPTLLKTVRGLGYRLDATVAWEPAPNQSCDCVICSSMGGTEALYAGRKPQQLHPNQDPKNLALANSDNQSSSG